MSLVNSYFMVAVLLAVLIGVIIVVMRWRSSQAVTNRMQRMMLCCGLDEDASVRADQLRNLSMDAAQSRCRICPVPDLCDRWLDGESIANNSFCPNAWHFIAAAGADQPSKESDYMSRWILGPP